jgi:hypothetical protein
MGTRGAFGFVVNGKEKVSYNHMDSYPSFLGRNILKDLQNLTSIENLKKNVLAIKMVEPNETPKLTPDQLEKFAEYSCSSVSTGDDWYSILRNAQGTIAPYCREENALDYMTDGVAFLQDSLFCEYAYIVNLDTNMVEFYRGFNNHLDAPGRYACPPELKAELNVVATNKPSGDYCGVALVGEAPIEAFMQATDEQIDTFIEKLEEYMANFDYENTKTLQIEDNS